MVARDHGGASMTLAQAQGTVTGHVTRSSAIVNGSTTTQSVARHQDGLPTLPIGDDPLASVAGRAFRAGFGDTWPGEGDLE